MKEIATLGAGCFWGVEETFRKLKGVIDVKVGYAGGSTQNPTYNDVCSGRTGHAEVVQIEFDPIQITFEKLLDVFWQSHDPTSEYRAGIDSNNQYRSIILYHSKEQQEKAEMAKENLEKSKTFSHPIITQIVPFEQFYVAEEYHQQFLEKQRRGIY